MPPKIRQELKACNHDRCVSGLKFVKYKIIDPRRAVKKTKGVSVFFVQLEGSSRTGALPPQIAVLTYDNGP